MIRFVSFCLVAAVMLPGCAAPRGYGTQGTAETWMILSADDPDLHAETARVHKQRSWGWNSHLVVSSSDAGPREIIIGPIAYADDDAAGMEVPYSVFADRPLSGRLVFGAVPSQGHRLWGEWNRGVERDIVMGETWRIDSVVVPMLGVPTESVTVRWITDVQQEDPIAD